MQPRQSKPEEVVMAGDGGRVPDVSEQRADSHEAGIEAATTVAHNGPLNACNMGSDMCETRPEVRKVVTAYFSHADPASVLAALLAESPEATVAAIEALLTRDAYATWAGRPYVAAACRSLLSKAPKEDGDA